MIFIQALASKTTMTFSLQEDKENKTLSEYFFRSAKIKEKSPSL